MTTLGEVIAFEESILAGSAALRSVQADAEKRARGGIARLRDGDEIDEVEVQLHEFYVQTLREFAARARQHVTPADEMAWAERVEMLPSSDWHDLLRKHGMPGAARLLNIMDLERSPAVNSAPLDAALAAAARICVCGYAKTGTMPKSLCHACGNAVGGAWVAEEHRLLQYVPGLQAETARILDGALTALADAGLDTNGDSYGRSVVALSRARSRLRRANWRHRREARQLDLARWRELAVLAKKTSMPLMNSEARKARRRLGMAELTQLAVPANPIVEQRMLERMRDNAQQ